MENIMEVKAESRKEVGKQIAKKLRKDGMIPAIIYGEKKESIPIALSMNDIKAILKSKMGENTILRIHRDKIKVDAMLKEIQYDYLSTNIIHADFIRIDLEKKIIVNVPIILTGEPVGVRLEEGILDFVNREIEVKCLPSRIPNNIEVDVTDLHTGNSLKVEILEFEEEIELITDPKRVICAVNIKGAAEEEVVEEEEEGIEGEEEAETEEGKKPEDKTPEDKTPKESTDKDKG
ncbi:MAG: 50S ribosomal protein L25 [Acidobacteriota bacterium]